MICPYCGYRFNAVRNPQEKEARPEAGQTTFCLSCGNVGKFVTLFDFDLNEHLVVRRITKEELEKVKKEDATFLSMMKEIRMEYMMTGKLPKELRNG